MTNADAQPFRAKLPVRHLGRVFQYRIIIQEYRRAYPFRTSVALGTHRACKCQRSKRWLVHVEDITSLSSQCTHRLQRPTDVRRQSGGSSEFGTATTQHSTVQPTAEKKTECGSALNYSPPLALIRRNVKKLTGRSVGAKCGCSQTLPFRQRTGSCPGLADTVGACPLGTSPVPCPAHSQLSRCFIQAPPLSKLGIALPRKPIQSCENGRLRPC